MLCPKCYRDIPPENIACPGCGEPRLEEAGDLKAAFGRGESAQGPGSCPWEERQERGTFAALGETLQQSLFAPSAFFGNLPPEGRIGAGLIYAVIVGSLTAVVAMMWQRVVGSPGVWLQEGQEIPPFIGYFWYLGLAVLPLAIVASIFFRSAILHLSLLLLGGAQRGYSATLKVVCYASSTSAFHVFPFCGSFIAFFWRIALIVIGLREVHRISTGKAVMAWLLPFLLVSCIAGAALLGLGLTLWKYFPDMGGIIAV